MCVITLISHIIILSSYFDLGIGSCGISYTTLEEIFLKLASDSVIEKCECHWKFFGVNLSEVLTKFTSKEKSSSQTLTMEKLEEYSSYTKLRVANKRKLIYQQFIALIIKRFHRVKRNLKGFIAEIVVPVIYVFLALMVATLIPANNLRPELELHPWYYLTPNKIFLSKGANIKNDTKYERIKQVTDTFYSSPGPGTRCMNEHQILVQKIQGIKGFKEKNSLKCFDSQYFSNNTILEKDRENLKNETIMSECSCSSGFLVCPNNLIDDMENKHITVLKTFDHLYDITGELNVTNWLLKTEFSKTFFKKRQGGYEFKKPKNLSNSNITDLFSDFSKFSKNLIRILNIATHQNQSISPVDYLNSLEFLGMNSLYSQDRVKIWFNPKGYASSVAFLNVLNNAFLRSKTSLLNKDPNDIGKIFIIHSFVIHSLGYFFPNH